MAYTQTQLNDLRAAIAEGVLKVSANGRTVEYRSLADMRQLERIMADELEQSTRRPERIYCSFRRA
jgi:arylamine N-acetyltransferase